MILRGCLFPLSLYLLSLGVSRAHSPGIRQRRRGLVWAARLHPIQSLVCSRSSVIRILDCQYSGPPFTPPKNRVFGQAPKGSRTIACDNIGLPFDSP